MTDHQTTTARPPLVTARQVAYDLGYSVNTIYNWAQTGDIPIAFRHRGRLRFDLDQVRSALAQKEATR